MPIVQHFLDFVGRYAMFGNMPDVTPRIVVQIPND